MLYVKNIDGDAPSIFFPFASLDAMPEEYANKCMLLDAAQDSDGYASIQYLGSRKSCVSDSAYYILSTNYCRIWEDKHGATVVSMKEE